MIIVRHKINTTHVETHDVSRFNVCHKRKERKEKERVETEEEIYVKVRIQELSRSKDAVY